MEDEILDVAQFEFGEELELDVGARSGGVESGDVELVVREMVREVVEREVYRVLARVSGREGFGRF